ncbi:hypothetical protein AAY473_009541 [Plecturocebus cupreus]
MVLMFVLTDQLTDCLAWGQMLDLSELDVRIYRVSLSPRLECNGNKRLSPSAMTMRPPKPCGTDRALGKKGSYEFSCSRLKRTCPAALNRTTELTAQHLSSYKRKTVSSSSSLTPAYPKSHLIKESSD